MKVLKTLIVTGLACLTALTSPVTLAEDKLPSGTAYQDIGPKIEAFVKEHEDTTAGMETAVVTADETLYEGHFGYVNKEKKIKADENAVFEWGSSSKTLVWISVMQQVEGGKLDLKEDIRTYLPEGFLKTLSFDKTITLLDLMNHKAGYQESQVEFLAPSTDKIIPLEDHLANYQPNQVYEPGTLTAYSNFGTALAGYIVERVSGQSYADYIQQKIFQPLGMTRSAIRLDMSDNPAVKKARRRNRSYDVEGKDIGYQEFLANPYPAGSIIGSLADLKTYAQALLKQEAGVIFQKKETWDQLFSASDTYGQTDLSKNQHGFWTMMYGVPVTEHGGNTTGYSNGLMLDLKNKVGLVVMTNQDSETIYNSEMPELVFGDFKDSAAAQIDRGKLSGHYISARSFAQGPFTLTKLMLYLVNSDDKQTREQAFSGFYQTEQLADGRSVIRRPVSDLIAVPEGQVRFMYGSLIAMAAAAVFAALQLLLTAGVWLYRKLTKKQALDRKQGWHQLVASGILLSAGLLAWAVFQMFSGNIAFASQVPYLAVSFAALALCLAGLLLWRLIFRPRGKQSWLAWTQLGLSVLTASITIWFIYYWDLYQWWVV